MLQANPWEESHFSEDLLVSVFNWLDHPRDLLTCAGVCKAWRAGKAKATLPTLDLSNDDLTWLLHLNSAQMAAVREVTLGFYSDTPEDATASIMLLAFICGRLPKLRWLKLYWGDPFQQEDFAEVGCTSDA